MKRFCVIIVVLFCIISTVLATEPEYQAPKKERFIEYLAGIKYLETANRLSKEDKIAYYKKLVEITGFNAETAQTYIEKYENDPERWLKVIESVLQIVNPPVEKGEE
jgi:hypothetical protein